MKFHVSWCVTEIIKEFHGFSAVSRTWQWTPEELVAATGSDRLTVAQHNLRLQSSYAEIEVKSSNHCRRNLSLVFQIY